MHDENERSWIIKVGGSNWVRHPGELTQDFLKAGSFGPRVFAEAVAREWPDSSIHEDPRKRISSLEEENRRMREVLRPFVNCLERTEVAYTPVQLAHIADGCELLDGITWGDLRRARAALSPKEQAE